MNMSELYEIWERPTSARYMIAGWQQWADAGAVSSGLPLYLLEQTQAAKIAEIHPDGFYLFQVPGTHDLFRPMVKLQEGHRESMEEKLNEFFFAGDDEHGFHIFLGEEPHLNEERYADAFFDVVEELGIERVAAVAGVYGAMPYEKERCAFFELRRWRDDQHVPGRSGRAAWDRVLSLLCLCPLL